MIPCLVLRNFLAWCCVRAGCFLSHNAPPFTCCLLLRLFRFVFDFVFGLKFVCSCGSLDYLVSAAALILFDQESPSPLTSLNNCVLLKHLSQETQGNTDIAIVMGGGYL